MSFLGLSRRKECGGQMGIFNGEEYVFTDSKYDIVTIAKLFWRYGWDVYRLNKLTDNMLSNFAR